MMEGISDLRIIGLDEDRPPKVRKEPYIDLIFKLSHKAPADWCHDFNSLVSRLPGTPKIKEKEGLFIESWVKKPDDIAPYLEKLKDKITQCNSEYIKRAELAAQTASDANDALAGEQGEQGRLNKIIAELDFGVSK